MLKRLNKAIGAVSCCILLMWFSPLHAQGTVAASTPTVLREGWQLASGCGMTDPLEQVSKAAYRPAGWLSVSVPSTVLAAQLAAGQIHPASFTQSGGAFDPFFGMNLRSVPGTDYPIGTFYSNQEIPSTSPYACGWIYRRAFTVKAGTGRRTYLRFAGINYRGEVWVNGHRIADQTEVAGAYRRYELDVTEQVHEGAGNVVAVETFAPGAKDLGINWVDWNPCPADKDMGLWGEVSLATSGPVTVRSPFVATRFQDDSLAAADLTVSALLQNRTDHAVRGQVEVRIAGLREPVLIKVPASLAPNEQREIVLTAEEARALRVQHPEIWWPFGLGGQHLDTVSVSFVAAHGSAPSDTAAARFGIRETSSELDAKGHRLFRINRHPILIRGGGWSPDMMLRESPERMRMQFAMVRDLHLNTVRLEGKLETDQFFNLADEQGVLVMAGWCCCDHWEHWKDWTPNDLTIATKSLQAQMLRLRSHPSMLVWLNGSDGPPPPNVENAYLAVEKETHWPNALLSSASATPTVPTGNSGVKMLGPYDYVVPSYWLRDTNKAGGAYGFNTETSPGPAIPDVAELKRFLPQDKLWPVNAVWDYHTGGGKYKSLAVMNRAMSNIYGAPADLEQYTRTADAMQYDAERAMFEAYGRNKYTSTGVVQWMLNNAWPSLIWHLYDYYLQPGAGYYGAKKANEPVHVQYSYDDASVVVVNSWFHPVPGLRVIVEGYDASAKQQLHEERSIDAAEDSVSRVLTLPKNETLARPLQFIRLRLQSASGQTLSINDYWLSRTATEFDWPKTDYTHTEPTVFENLQYLRELSPARVEARMLPPRPGEPLRVELMNPSGAIAFQVMLESREASGKPYDSLLWDDNYVELLPGERRVLTARPLAAASMSRLGSLRVSGWNVPPQSVAVPRTATLLAGSLQSSLR